jgi:hypothetical protein
MLGLISLASCQWLHKLSEDRTITRTSPLGAGLTHAPMIIMLLVKDANGLAVAYVYYEEEPGRRAAANLMTKEEARRIAANIVKLPELLKRP